MSENHVIRNERDLLSYIPHRIFMKNRDLVYTYANKVFAADFGLKPEEIPGKTDLDLSTESRARKFRADDTSVMEHGTEIDVVEEHERNGERIIVRTLKRPIYDEDGENNGVIGIFWEVTGEHRNKEALEETRSYLRAALEASDLGTWTYDIENELMQWDDRSSLIFGLSGRNEGDQTFSLSVVHPDDRTTVKKALSATIQDGKHFEEEYKVIWPDGSLRYVKANGERYKDYRSSKLKISGTLADITDRWRTDEALKSILAMNRFMKGLSLNEIIQKGLEESTIITGSRISCFLSTHNNDGSESLYSWTGTDMVVCDKSEEAADLQEIIRDLINTVGGEFKPLILNKFRNGNMSLPGTDINVTRALIVPVVEDSKAVAAIVVGNKRLDYTQHEVDRLSLLADNIWSIVSRKRIEEELDVAHAEALAANQIKDKFFSIIAHDLSTPISNIRILSDQLESLLETKETDKDNLIEISGILQNSASNAQSLLKNLLTWSRSQRGTITYEPTFLDAFIPAYAALSTCNAVAGSKNIAIESDWQENITLYGDINMLQTILRNLLTNAIKFTVRGGKIVFRIRQAGENVVFSVKDHGIGISDERVSNLFIPGENHSTRGTEAEKGTGLGLVLCKEFVDRHQGSISVESSPGEGSTFTVTIPSSRMQILERVETSQ